MLIERSPTPYANRGKALEAAIIASCLAYERRGLACVQKVPVPMLARRDGTVVRTKSTVDFVGVARGIAVAFDAKHVARGTASWPRDKRYEHQRAFLRAFEAAGGVGGLLVEFAGRAFFMASIWWLEKQLVQRASIRLEAFDGAAAVGVGVQRIEPGIGGVPLPFLPAVSLLRESCPRSVS